MSPTNYPAALDTTTELPNNRTDATASVTNHAPDHNNLSDAVRAIEGELGTAPRGTFADVKSRLVSLERANAINTALGIVTENYRCPISDNSGAVGSQRIGAALAGFVKGDVVTNLVFGVAVAGVGTVPTLIRCGLADKTGVILALTADLKASTIWTANTGYAVAALTAPYTILSTDGYYIVFLQNGTFGTTNLALHFARGQADTANAIGSGVAAFASQDSQTDLPAVSSSMTLSTGGNTPRFWVGAS